ncbi:MAG TPA: hypothetical protein VFX20_14905 [Steroidobacteraceae bacterium]|nr:hypothetical protein [Steroidobacteraceae bacterium]
MVLKSLVKGLLTNIPGVEPLLRQRTAGVTQSASYAYWVWMKHLTLLWENGLQAIPETVAELGPGDSLGVGLAAILCGARRYFALDVQKYANTAANLAVLDELVALFRARAPRPSAGWPDFDGYLDERLFPSHILTDELLCASLADSRIDRIRDAIANPARSRDGISVSYIVPWTDASVLVRDSVDVLLSHSVLEHVVDLETTYRALALWLKPNGLTSHQIDFDSHGITAAWNGYRAYSETFWRVLLGKRLYMINREPLSTHVRLLRSEGLEMTCLLQAMRTDGIPRSRLAPRWRSLSDEDLNCSGAFVQARRIDGPEAG